MVGTMELQLLVLAVVHLDILTHGLQAVVRQHQYRVELPELTFVQLLMRMAVPAHRA
jgi:hypothetical protein